MKAYELINLLNTLTEAQKQYEITMEVETPDDEFYGTFEHTINHFEMQFVADKHEWISLFGNKK